MSWDAWERRIKQIERRDHTRRLLRVAWIALAALAVWLALAVWILRG